MAGLAGILGNPILEQLLVYNVVGQLIGPALGPFQTSIANAVNSQLPEVALSPADLALAVIRNELDEAAAAGEAAKSGINAERFHTLTRLTGDAPAPESMAIALRREFVDAGTYLRGIRQGRLRDEWAELVQRLATEDPSPTTALLAYLKGQEDKGTATAVYQRFGGNPDHFDLAYNVEGQGPSPLEAADAARRGIIPWGGVGAGVTSFEQAVHESAYRNKWEPVFRVLTEYLPQPRTVTAMHREGAFSDAQAAELFAKDGLTPDLAKAYLLASSRAKTAHARQLSESTIRKLYTDRLVTRPQAEGFLTALGYNAAEAALILEADDLAVATASLAAAVSRIRSYYIGHKIDPTQATAALAALHVDNAQAAELVGIWEHERAANVRLLTPAQIEAAFGLNLLTEAEALTRLAAEGYTAGDAWLALAIHNKGPLVTPKPV